VPAQDDWPGLETEFNRLYEDARYKPLRPLMDRAEALLRTRESYGAVELLLDVIRTFHEREKQGPVGIDGIRDIAEIATQNFQARGHIFHAANGPIVLDLIQQAAPEMRLPEPAVEVAVALLVMTQKEAKALAAGEVFDDQVGVLKENFASLAEHLKKNGLESWTDHYGATPEEWRPRGGQKTIAQHVTNALGRLNDEKEFEKSFLPKFYDVRAVDSTTSRGRSLLRTLRTKGCIVMVDAISLRHPALLRAYQRSLLDVFPTTSVVTLTPDGNAFELMKSMVHALQMSLEESEFSLRMADLLDGMACQEYSDATKMLVWMVERVRKICGPAASKGGVRMQMQT
jgi:hypothetical protein